MTDVQTTDAAKPKKPGERQRLAQWEALVNFLNDNHDGQPKPGYYQIADVPEDLRPLLEKEAEAERKAVALVVYFDRYGWRLRLVWREHIKFLVADLDRKEARRAKKGPKP